MGSHIDVIVNMIYWQLSHFRAILPINISIFIVSETSAPVHWPLPINISIFIVSETSAPVHWPNLNKYCQRILKFVGKFIFYVKYNSNISSVI